MSFNFSLATVLRVRGILEEREERLLQKILFEISQSLDSLTKIDSEMARSDVSRNEDIFKPFLGHNLHASYGEVKALKQQRKDIEGQIIKLKELRDKQLVVYEGARRSREMLTDMHDEQRSVFDSDTSRREQKTLDDNYIARRGRC
jgi:flagellar export protein FliJ